MYTIHDLDIMMIRQQIEDIEEWLRDHPMAQPDAIHEMRLRLHEQTKLLNNKINTNATEPKNI